MGAWYQPGFHWRDERCLACRRNSSGRPDPDRVRVHSRRLSRTVFDAHPDDVRVPSLVVANVDDRCKVAPPSMAQSIAQSIRHAPTTVLTVSGGTQRTQDDCGSLTPHGYYGIEEKVVDGIVDWMQKTQNRT